MIVASSFRLARRCARHIVQTRNHISTSSIASARLFTEKHEWVAVENENEKQVGRVGISQHAQEALGDVVFVQVPDIGVTLKQFDEAGAIESVKAASEILSPLSGKVVEVNSKLEEKPGLVNTDCYGDGWLFDIEISDKQELDKLMSEDQYVEFLEKTKDS